jgi:drug/metabolite transporter (DMT)-like permease
MRAGSRLTPFAALGLAILLWGGGFYPTELGLQSASSTTLNVLRAAPAALLLLIWTAWMRRTRTPSSLALSTVISGVLMIGVFTAAISEGTARAGAANTAVLLNTHPFWVLLLARTFLLEPVGRVAVAGIVLGFAGVVATVAPQLGSSGNASQVALGLGAALAGAWAWATGTILVRRTATREQDFDVLRVTTGQYVAGAAFLALVALPQGADADWNSRQLWLAVAWLAIGTSALATLLFLFALRRIDAVRASTWQFLVPVVAIIIEIARGNAPEPIVFAGMAVTILGVAIASGSSQLDALWQRRRRASALEKPASQRGG